MNRKEKGTTNTTFPNDTMYRLPTFVVCGGTQIQMPQSPRSGIFGLHVHFLVLKPWQNMRMFRQFQRRTSIKTDERYKK